MIQKIPQGTKYINNDVYKRANTQQHNTFVTMVAPFLNGIDTAEVGHHSYETTDVVIRIEFNGVFRPSKTKDRSTTHPTFNVKPTRVRTHDLQIMAVHFMPLRRLL